MRPAPTATECRRALADAEDRMRERQDIDILGPGLDPWRMETKVGAPFARLFQSIILFCIPAGGLSAAESPTSKPALLLADVWNESIDPTGWWISEKYDGVRGYWDGRQLRLRGGGTVNAPEYFLAELPQGVALDGELWMGRGRFEETVSVVRRVEPDEHWRAGAFLFRPLQGVVRVVAVVGEFAGLGVDAVFGAVLDATVDPGAGEDLVIAIEHKGHGAMGAMP